MITVLSFPRMLLAARASGKAALKGVAAAAPTSRAAIVVSVCVGIVATAVRVLYLARPLWLDEIASARVLSAPSWSALIAQIEAHEGSPPLWYSVVYGAHRGLAGIGVETSLADWRGLSVAAGGLAAGMTVLLATRVVPLRAAGLAGILIGLGAMLVEKGSELRVYSLLLLVAVALMLAVVRATERPTVPRFAVVGFVALVGIYTQYFFALLWVVVLGWAVVDLRGRTRVGVVAALVLGAAPGVVWAPYVSEQAGHVRNFIGPYRGSTVVDAYARLFAGALTPRPAKVGVFFVVCCGAWLLRRSPVGRLFAIAATAPVAVAAGVWAAGTEVFDARNLIVCTPSAAIAVAAFAAWFPRRVATVIGGALAVGIVVSLVATQVTLGRTPSDRIAQALVAEGWRGQPVEYFDPKSYELKPVAWYLPGHPTLRSDPAGACTNPFVVSDTPNGDRWLHSRGVTLLGSPRRFPFYGHGPSGRREGSVVVVRVHGEPGAILAARLAGATALVPTSRATPC